MGECKNKWCKRRAKIMTKEGICYYCFVKKHKRAPNKKEYGGHKLD